MGEDYHLFITIHHHPWGHGAWLGCWAGLGGKLHS